MQRLLLLTISFGSLIMDFVLFYELFWSQKLPTWSDFKSFKIAALIVIGISIFILLFLGHCLAILLSFRSKLKLWTVFLVIILNLTLMTINGIIISIGVAGTYYVKKLIAWKIIAPINSTRLTLINGIIVTGIGIIYLIPIVLLVAYFKRYDLSLGFGKLIQNQAEKDNNKQWKQTNYC